MAAQFNLQPPPLSDRLRKFLEESSDEESGDSGDEISISRSNISSVAPLPNIQPAASASSAVKGRDRHQSAVVKKETIEKLVVANDQQNADVEIFHPLIMLDADDLMALEDLEEEDESKEIEPLPTKVEQQKKEDAAQKKWDEVIQKRKQAAKKKTKPPPPPLDEYPGAQQAKADMSAGTLHISDTWEPDNASDSCRLCATKFGLINRRHHCRVCGRLVCGGCSKSRLQVALASKQKALNKKAAVRVCDGCKAKFQGS